MLDAKAKTDSHDPDAHFRQRHPRARRARRGRLGAGAARGARTISPATGLYALMDIRAKQRAVVDALEDVKGRDIVVFNAARHTADFERVVIASGDSNRQVKALADRVQERMREQGASVVGVEGERTASGCWWTSATWWCTSCIRRCAATTTSRRSGAARTVKMDEAKPKAKTARRRSEAAKKPPVPRLRVVAVSVGCRPGRKRPATNTRSACRKGYEVERLCESKPRRGQPAARIPRALVALDERGKDLTHRAVRRAAAARPPRS